MTLGGLFTKIYSFESFLYEFWIWFIFGGPFWGNFLVFEIFRNVFGIRMGDFEGSIRGLCDEESSGEVHMGFNPAQGLPVPGQTCGREGPGDQDPQGTHPSRVYSAELREGR